MSVIIRLQNLPWSANSLDIRQYFRGLSIPEGGVHIVGGEMGDAFIAFSTDEDARQAMMLAGGKIKEVQISLMLSSRSEMQKIIEAARQASMSNSLAQLLAPSAAVAMPNLAQSQMNAKERRDSKGDKKDSSDLSSSSHETGKADKRDRRDKSRSRSRDRGRKDRKDRDRDRDRDRDKRRRSRSRSRSRDRRRKRSRSRSRGRDNHNRYRDRKDFKEDVRKDDKMNPGQPTIEPGTNVPNLDILNPNPWNVMQTGALTQNTQLLTNFELLRNLATQKGPLLPGGPPSLLPTPMHMENEQNLQMFSNRGDSPSSRTDFGNANKGNGGRSRFQDNSNFGGDRRFDRNMNQNNFQNFGPGFPMRNGNEAMNNPRFGNFSRGDNGFLPRGPGSMNREHPNSARGLLDLPVSGPQRDRFSNSRDDRVDEFGRSIQLRNRNNLSNEEPFKDDGSMGGDQPNYQGFPNRFGKNQQNQRMGPMMRGRDNWQSGGRNNDNFQDRRGFRGSFEDSGRGFKSKNRDFGKHHEDNDPSSKSPIEKDCCVEIRNLSPQIAYGEVRRPFSNLKLIIREIKFFDYSSNDKKCRIKFLNNENKRKAIQMSSKIVIDSKQVHLLHINDSDFDECIDEGVRRPEMKFSDDEDDDTLSAKDVYIQVKDLPLNVEEVDIVNLFPNMKLEKVLLEMSADGKSKTAFVKFNKAVDAKVVLGTPNQNIRDCAVFLSPLPQYVFNDHLNKAQQGGQPEIPEVMDAEGSKADVKGVPDECQNSSCVLMKNLPLEATDRDICDFFSDIGLVPNKIHLMLDMEGQPSGDAFCEFSDYHQMERACSKNSAHLGKNIVTVSKVPRHEMLEALGVSQSPMKSGTPTDGPRGPQCIVAMENIPFRAGVYDIINFFGWSYNLTEKDVCRRYNEKGQPTGDGKVCFRSPEDALRAIRILNNRSLMGRVIRMKLL